MKRRKDGRKEKDRLDVTFATFYIFIPTSTIGLVSTKSISTARLVYTVYKYDFKRNHLNVWFLVYAISRQWRSPRSLSFFFPLSVSLGFSFTESQENFFEKRNSIVSISFHLVYCTFFVVVVVIYLKLL